MCWYPSITQNRYYKDQPISVVYRNNRHSEKMYEAHTLNGHNANLITFKARDTASN